MDPIKQEDGSFKNEAGAVVNEAGVLLDDDGALINEEGYLINEAGQLLNEEGKAVNAEGLLLDADNKVIEGQEENTDDGKFIPKGRYDSAARRAKAAEAELATTKAELAKLAKNDGDDTPVSTEEFEKKIEELDTKIEEARKDGDVDAVVRLSKEQRTYERGMYQHIANDAAEGAGTKAQQKAALDVIITKLENDYDAFNPDSKNFDQDVVDEVLDLQGAFIAKGDSPAQAMLKAVGYVIGEDDASIDGKGGRTTDVGKNLDAAGRQAPGMGKTGKSSAAGGDTGDDVDISNLTQEEFDALPKETIKRLRGDSYAEV